jgi:hypothetical protein
MAGEEGECRANLTRNTSRHQHHLPCPHQTANVLLLSIDACETVNHQFEQHPMLVAALPKQCPLSDCCEPVAGDAGILRARCLVSAGASPLFTLVTPMDLSAGSTPS